MTQHSIAVMKISCAQTGTDKMLHQSSMSMAAQDNDVVGVRNSVGMQFHPESHILYFSCNGRNNLGDDVPDDYIASAPTSGLDFGFPHCHRYTLFYSQPQSSHVTPVSTSYWT